MTPNLKETVGSPEHGVTLPESHEGEEEAEAVCLWTAKHPTPHCP